MDAEEMEDCGPLVRRWQGVDDHLNILEPQCESAGGQVRENEHSHIDRELRP